MPFDPILVCIIILGFDAGIDKDFNADFKT